MRKHLATEFQPRAKLYFSRNATVRKIAVAGPWNHLITGSAVKEPVPDVLLQPKGKLVPDLPHAETSCITSVGISNIVKEPICGRYLVSLIKRKLHAPIPHLSVQKHRGRCLRGGKSGCSTVRWRPRAESREPVLSAAPPSVELRAGPVESISAVVPSIVPKM